ncbi:response regulator [Bradyrhizobium sp. LjRoot220]|uniref:response regulator n=1 Tax=Bradyrhizobium sp. LjRoot220 TaxID=3342284 RepID=UPI003ECD48AE
MEMLALWQWSSRSNRIVWTDPSTPAPLRAGKDRSRSIEGEAQVAINGTTVSLSHLARTAVKDNSAFTGRVVTCPACPSAKHGLIFGRKVSRFDASGAIVLQPIDESRHDHDLTGALIEGIEALPEAFVLYDAQDRLLICNEQYRGLYPTVADLMVPGLYFPDLVRESIRRGVFKINEDEEVWAQRRISFHQAGIGFFEQQLSDGRWIQVSERRTASGGITSIRADITVLKERERDLRTARAQAEGEIAMRAQFIAKVGHELRNPLNVIFGVAQLLEGEGMSKRQKAMMSSLLGAARSMRDVLNDILDVASVSSGHLNIRRETVECRPLLDEMTNIAKLMADQRGLKFHSRMRKDLPDSVATDPRRLRQIILNLLGNAFKYTSSGAIAFAASRGWSDTGDAVIRITITDTGPGIAKDRKDELFVPYSRQKEHIEAGIEGYGLGLSICEELAQAIGARVGLSPAARRGTRAWVEIPLASKDEADPMRAVARPRPPLAAGPPLSVLVVDDEQTNLIVVEALLKRLGHTVTTALDGVEGLHALQREAYDAVLLDISMQEMSGIEVARKVATMDLGGRHPPIIALTGNALPEEVKTYFAAGFTGFIEKPVSLEQLAEALANTRAPEGVSVLEPKDRIRFPQRADVTGTFDSARLDRMVVDIGRDNVRAIVVAAIATFRKTAAELARRSSDRRKLGRLLHKVHSVAGLFGFEELAAKAFAPKSAGEEEMSRPRAEALRHDLTNAIAQMQAYASELEAPALPLT